MRIANCTTKRVTTKARANGVRKVLYYEVEDQIGRGRFRVRRSATGWVVSERTADDWTPVITAQFMYEAVETLDRRINGCRAS